MPESDHKTQTSEIDNELAWEAVGSLAAEARQIFEMHFRKGMTHSEISESLAVPLGTVKTRLRRGLIELKKFIEARENRGEFQPKLSQ